MNPREETLWPPTDTCSECGNPVKLVFDIEDPVYTHIDPTMPEEPERCDPNDENLIATTHLRDQRAPTSRTDPICLDCPHASSEHTDTADAFCTRCECRGLHLEANRA